MLLINGQNTQPYYNMAMEEYYLTKCKEEVILLWRNTPCIVVGKNQNTLDEINPEYVEKYKIPVVRRLSGGGAVVHDLGNLNFTMIQNKKEECFNDFAKFTEPVCGFLNNIGVHAVVNGRNDITVEAQKVSGNAQTVKNGRILHHGTLLFCADLSRLSKALNPNPVKYQSKGVASVRSRVANITEFLKEPISIETFTEQLFTYFSSIDHDSVIHEISTEEDAVIFALAENKYALWEWNYGQSPNYDFCKCKRFDFGTVDVRLAVQNGVIGQASIYGDFFSRNDKDKLEKLLVGCRHNKKELQEKIYSIKIEEYISGMKADEFITLLYECG